MSARKKAVARVEVRGYEYGKPIFEPQYFQRVNQALDFIATAFEMHRMPVCFLDTGELHPDDTFVPHEDSVCMRITATPRRKVVAA